MACDWIILLEVAGNPAAPSLALETVEQMLARLADRYPSALHAPDRCAVQFVVHAEGPDHALCAGLATWREATKDLTPPGWDLVRAEVKTPAELAAEHAVDEAAHPTSVADPQALAAAYQTTRELLRLTRAGDAVPLLASLVARLGGTVGPIALDDPRALAIDLSLGVTDTIVPFAEPLSIARLCLEDVLPAVVEDAARVVARLRGSAPTSMALAKHDRG